MTRIELPTRRPHRKVVVEFPTHDGGLVKMHVTVSFAALAPTRIPVALEVFIRGGGKVKVGSERDFLLDDIAVTLSLLLQAGRRPKTIRRSLGADSADPARPLSIIAAVVDTIITLEAEFRAEHPEIDCTATAASCRDGAEP